MKTTMLAMDMVDPVMLFVIPGNPSTTASTITSTMTPTTRRMNEGMTGVKAPQVLFDVESVISYTWKDYRYGNGILLCRNLDLDSGVTV